MPVPSDYTVRQSLPTAEQHYSQVPLRGQDRIVKVPDYHQSAIPRAMLMIKQFSQTEQRLKGTILHTDTYMFASEKNDKDGITIGDQWAKDVTRRHHEALKTCVCISKRSV